MTLINLTNSECTEGCLKCDSKDDCLFCDTQNKFILDSKTCKQVELSNCKILEITGNCMVCSEGYYRDSQQFKCVKHINGSTIDKCLNYSGFKQCSNCVEGYFVKNALCQAVPSKISNCILYNQLDPSICEKCAKGFVLNLVDQKSCVKVSLAANCSSYSQLQCMQCETGYFIENSKYIQEFFKFETIKEKAIVLEKLLNDKNGIIDQGYKDQCEKIEIENCQEYTSYYQCKKCKDKFYLNTDLLCFPFPREKINHCEIYETYEKCIKCEINYILSEKFTCVTFNKKTNCKKHDPSKQSPFCLECEDDFFLEQNNNCQARTSASLFAECAQRSITSDSCNACSTGKHLTSDKKKCLDLVENCKNYEDSDINTTILICNTCQDNYFYDQTANSCQKGTQTNCKEYERTTNQCSVCEEKYYLFEGQCLKQPELDFCVEYSKTLNKKCIKCENNSYNFEIESGCIKVVEPIQKCIVYESNTKCQECELDYFVQNGACVAIDTALHCRKLDPNNLSQCIHCQENYFINESKKCQLPEDYLVTFCEKNNINGMVFKENVQCQFCRSQAIPINYKENFVCTKKDVIPSTQLVDKCIKYTSINSIYTCVLCEDEYKLSTINNKRVCVENCDLGLQIQQFKIQRVLSQDTFGNYRHFYVQTYKECVKLQLDSDNKVIPAEEKFINCAYRQPNLNILKANNGVDATELDQVCGYCDATAQPTILQDSFIHTNDPLNNHQGTSLLSFYPGITCNSLIKDSKTILKKTTNCMYYYKLRLKIPSTDIEYACLSCKLGYHGVIKAENYIETCVPMESCADQSTVNKDGVTLHLHDMVNVKTPWSSYISCYECIANKEIPFIALQIDDKNSFTAVNSHTKFPHIKPYTLTSQTDFTGSGGFSTECFQPIAANLNFQENNFKFPENCAFGVINISRSTKNSNGSILATMGQNDSAVYCLACKPKFRPSYVTQTDANSEFFRAAVYNCSDIGDNCKNSIWYNACSECREGTTYVYDHINHLVDYSTCEMYNDPNCFAFYTHNQNSYCQYCKKGYSKNFDGICEIINAPQCLTNKMIFKNDYKSSNDKMQYNLAIWFLPKGLGCLQCLDNYVSLEVKSDSYYCTISQYLINQNVMDQTKLISNCLNHYINDQNEFICKVCKSNYIPSSDGKCYLQSQRPNCILFEPNLTCKQCQEGFVLLSGICQEKNLENCKEYLQGQNLTSQQCKTCNQEYYWNGTACILGQVKNCLILISPTKCQQCLPNYGRVVIKNNIDYCYPIELALQCKAIVSDKFIEEKISCEECNQGHYKTTDLNLLNRSVCMQFGQVENCINYSLSNHLELSDLKCLKCKDLFYLDKEKNLCVTRTREIENCKVKKIEKDECAECEQNYFLANEDLKCEKYPDGIANCIDYFNQQTCLGCEKNYYLSNNQCLEIDEVEMIDNCIYYKGDKTCSVCEDKYAQVNGSCVVSQAQNCKTFKSKSACDSCFENYGFKEENSIINCVQKNVNFCQISNETFPFKCLQCINEFYPDKDGICQQVTNKIENCLIYSADNQCSLCEKNTTLSINKGECLEKKSIQDMLDQKCLYSKLVEPFCNSCQKGFYLDENYTCQQCSLQQSQPGCYACTLKNQNECILCDSGFYQMKNNTCNQLDKNISNTDTTPTNDVQTKLNLLMGVSYFLWATFQFILF